MRKGAPGVVLESYVASEGGSECAKPRYSAFGDASEPATLSCSYTLLHYYYYLYKAPTFRCREFGVFPPMLFIMLYRFNNGYTTETVTICKLKKEKVMVQMFLIVWAGTDDSACWVMRSWKRKRSCFHLLCAASCAFAECP